MSEYTIDKRLLGRTGLYVSALCLGTMTFGGRGFWEAMGRLQQAEVNNLVARSLDAGINFIDTADVYSEGESERLTGAALKGRRDKVILATKVFNRMGPDANDIGLSRYHIMRAVEDSLRRLNTDYIDLYQIHAFDPLTPLDETLRALDDLVHSGKVRYIGCCNLAAWQLMKALAISDRHGLARFQSTQNYYTIAGRDLERELLPLALDQQVGVLVWSPLAGGLLSGKFTRENAGPEGARRSMRDFPPVNKARAYNVIDAMAEVAAEHDATVARVALAWLLHQRGVTSVIIGAKSLDQLEDNLRAPALRLSAEQLQKLDAVSALEREYPEWMMTMQSAGRIGA